MIENIEAQRMLVRRKNKNSHGNSYTNNIGRVRIVYLEDITENNEETEDCIAAMLLLNDTGTEKQFQAENV